MPKKKILHLITGLEVGGTEMMLLKTLPRLQGDFDNYVCCIIGHGPIGKRLEKAGIHVHYLELKNIFDVGAVWKFRKVVKEFRPDILVTYLIHADLFGRVFGRLFGIRRIICNQRGKLLQWEFLRIVDRATKFLVTKYIVQTETAKQELMRKLHLPGGRFEVIPNVIDPAEFNFEIDIKKKREELDLSPDDIVIICVSKLRRGKGHEYLLEAFETLSLQTKRGDSKIGKPKLIIVGDGEQKETLLKQVGGYTSKPDILFLGNRTDVKEILAISDIFVLPTLGEGMSNAIMEAMASGLPVITTDIPENCELIENGGNGILIPPMDTDSLVQTMENLLNNTRQRDLLRKNAKNQILKLFNINTTISKLEQLLLSLR